MVCPQSSPCNTTRLESSAPPTRAAPSYHSTRSWPLTTWFTIFGFASPKPLTNCFCEAPTATVTTFNNEDSSKRGFGQQFLSKSPKSREFYHDKWMTKKDGGLKIFRPTGRVAHIRGIFTAVQVEFLAAETCIRTGMWFYKPWGCGNGAVGRIKDFSVISSNYKIDFWWVEGILEITIRS